MKIRNINLRNMKNFIEISVILKYVLLFAQLFQIVYGKYDVIYAINAGGDGHIDKNGIRFEKDPLKIGTASDYGKNLLMISKVPQPDEILYQTERYHTVTFGYDIPIAGDGEYLLILKFCEVYFNDANMKVFDVTLNGEHTIISDLDIYRNVGKGAGYDDYIYFTIKHSKLYYKEEVSLLRGNKLKLEFIKGSKDNPKINAFVLLQGDIEDLQRLQPSNIDDDEDADDEQLHQHQQQYQQQQQHHQNQFQEQTDHQIIDNDDDLIDKPNKLRKTSGPKQPNPYAMDESSISAFIPLFVAIGAFIPLLFCVCKL